MGKFDDIEDLTLRADVELLSKQVVELEKTLIRVMFPASLEKHPTYTDIKSRVNYFFSISVNNVMDASNRVIQERWPEATGPDETMLEKMLSELIQSGIPQSKCDGCAPDKCVCPVSECDKPGACNGCSGCTKPINKNLN